MKRQINKNQTCPTSHRTYHHLHHSSYPLKHCPPQNHSNLGNRRTQPETQSADIPRTNGSQ
ncbi:hypothetical protein BJX66DRAFT_251734 [Aspergillus keveii]|uniref:Uncharacterized protein n=1 Tax=Aspergillus keveii TaxID=714993 RepID=A0ABR4FZP3_9EURO